jgi:hypothetical protein
MQPWVFSDQQLAELRKTSLSQLLCAHTDLGQVQPRAFETVDDFEWAEESKAVKHPMAFSNHPVACNSSLMASPDWRAWKDEEPHIQVPFSQRTMRRALELGLERMLERRKRETRNIAKSESQTHYLVNAGQSQKLY